MSPISNVHDFTKRYFNPAASSNAYRDQWNNPSDVFSVLLLLGGDVVSRALGQLAGTGFTPVAFSFGWVAYAVSALVSSVGENKLMPEPDCDGLVVNAGSGNVRSNSSWVIGRIVRDFEHWAPKQTKSEVQRIIGERHKKQDKDNPGAERPSQAGLCVTVFEASDRSQAGVQPILTGLSVWSIAVIIFQLGIAAIPCGVFGDWGTLMVTISGVALSTMFGSLKQWRREKWACRRNCGKAVVLTRSNGTQHAIMILGKGLEIGDHGRGLDLEDLAAVASNVEVVASFTTRIIVGAFAILWVLLLITAAGTKSNTWFLLAVGGIGILQNAAVAGFHRKPKDLGVPLKFVEVIAHHRVMQALVLLEERYPRSGRSLRDIFFQGKLSPKEAGEWEVLDLEADHYEALRRKDKAEMAVAKAKKALGMSTHSPQAVSIPIKTDNPTSSHPTKDKQALDDANKLLAESIQHEKIAESAAFTARSRISRDHGLFRTVQWAWKVHPLQGSEFYT